MAEEAFISNTFLKRSQRIFRSDPNLYLRCAVEDPQTVTAIHRHEFTEVVLVLGGTGEHQCEDNVPQPIRRGNIFVIPTGGKHGYVKAEELRVLNMMFDAKRLPPVLLELYNHSGYKYLFAHNFDYYKERDFPSLLPSEEEFETLEDFALKLCDDSQLHCYKLGLFMVLLSLLCNTAKHCTAEECAQAPLNIPRLTKYLNNNYLQDIYLDDLTVIAGMSRATLIRHFRQAMGITPMKYICNLRLKYAAELLINSELTLKEIALSSKFSSMPYFFRAFRKHFGIPPQEWRKQKNNK